MSARSIEAEVSIKSGVKAECTIGREVIVEAHDDVNLESLTVTANGQYEPSEGVNGFSDVTVTVPERIPMTESLSVTENGTYEPNTGVDGYDRVTVAVPPTIPDIESLTATANGTYTAEGDGFNPVVVNVAPPKDPNVCEGEFTASETGVLTIDTEYEGDSFPKAIMIYDADGIIKSELPLAYTISAFSAVKGNGQMPTYNADNAENQYRYVVTYTNASAYTTTASQAYICTQTTPAMGATNSVKMPDNHTLKVYVTDSTSSTATRFRVGTRYKYKVFY